MNFNIVVSSNHNKIITASPIIVECPSNNATVINRTKKRNKYWPKSVCAREVVSLCSTDEIFAGAIVSNHLEMHFDDTIKLPSQEDVEESECEPEQSTSADLRSKLTNIFKRPALPPFRPVRLQPQVDDDVLSIYAPSPSNFSFSTTIEDNPENDNFASPTSLDTDKLHNISTWLNTGYTTSTDSSHSDQHQDLDNYDVTDAVVTDNRCSSPSAYSTVSDWTTMSVIVDSVTPATTTTTTTIKPAADNVTTGDVLLQWKRPTEPSRGRLGPPAKRLAPSRLPQTQPSGKVTVRGVSGHNDTCESTQNPVQFQPRQYSTPNKQNPHVFSTPHLPIHQPPPTIQNAIVTTQQCNNNKPEAQHNNTIQQSSNNVQRQTVRNNQQQSKLPQQQQQSLQSNNHGSGQQQQSQSQLQRFDSTIDKQTQQQQRFQQSAQKKAAVFKEKPQQFNNRTVQNNTTFENQPQEEVTNSYSKKGLVPPQTIKVTANLCKPNEKPVVRFQTPRVSPVSPESRENNSAEKQTADSNNCLPAKFVQHRKTIVNTCFEPRTNAQRQTFPRQQQNAIVDNSLENDANAMFPQQQQQTFVVNKSPSQQRNLKLLSSPRRLNQSPPDQRKNLNNPSPGRLNPNKQLLGQLNPNNQLLGQLNPNKQLLGQLNPNKQLLGQLNPNKQLLGQLNPNNQLLGQLNPNNQLPRQLNPNKQLLGQLNPNNQLLPVLPPGQSLSDLIIYKNCSFLFNHPTCLYNPHHTCPSPHHYDMSSLRALLSSAASLATLQRTYRELLEVAPHRLWPLFGGFVAGFGAARSRRDLYQMVVRVMEEDVYKTPLLEEVIGALCGLGMGYREAVGGMLKYVGYQNQNLVALLLSLLVEHSTCLKSDWPLISDLLDNVAHIDHGVMADLLLKCVQESVSVDMREILQSLAQLLLKPANSSSHSQPAAMHPNSDRQEQENSGAVSNESYPLLCKIPGDQIAGFRRVLGDNGLGEYAGMLAELLGNREYRNGGEEEGEQLESGLYNRMDDFQEEFDGSAVPEMGYFDYRLPPPPVVPPISIISRVPPPPTLQHRLPSLPRRVPPTAAIVTSSQQSHQHSYQQSQQQVVATNRPDYGNHRIRPPYSYSTQTSQSLSTSSIEDSTLLQQETKYPGLNYLIANNTPSDSDDESYNSNNNCRKSISENAMPERIEESVDPRLISNLPTFDMIKTTVATFILDGLDGDLLSLFAKFSRNEKELVKPICKLIFDGGLPVMSSYEIFLKMWNNMVTMNSEYLQPILLSFGLNLYEFLTEQEYYKESVHLIVTINKNQLLLRNKPYYSNLHNSTIMERCHHIINTFVCANNFKEAFEWFQLHAYHTVSVGPLDKQFLVKKRELLDSFLNSCTDLNICYKLVRFCLVKNVPLDYGRHFNIVVIKILNSNHKSLLLDDMELVLKYREHLSVSALRGLVVEYFNHLTTTQSMLLFNQLTSLEIYPLLEADSTVIYLTIGLLSEEIRLILNAYINLKATACVDSDSDRITDDVTLFIERRVTSVDRATPVYPKNLINTAVDVAGMRVRLVNTLKLCYPPVLPVLVTGGEEEELRGNTVMVTATSLRALLAGRRLRDGKLQ